MGLVSMGQGIFSHFFFGGGVRFSLFLFRSSSLFSPHSPQTRANNCNLVKKWGISLRPCLHRPRSELLDMLFCSPSCCRQFWSRKRCLQVPCPPYLFLQTPGPHVPLQPPRNPPPARKPPPFPARGPVKVGRFVLLIFFSPVVCPWVRPDYICNSKTTKSVRL